MKNRKQVKAPGAAPFIQGVFARAWGQERKPPDWHEGHEDEEWIVEWCRGWDEAREKKLSKLT